MAGLTEQSVSVQHWDVTWESWRDHWVVYNSAAFLFVCWSSGSCSRWLNAKCLSSVPVSHFMQPFYWLNNKDGWSSCSSRMLPAIFFGNVSFAFKPFSNDDLGEWVTASVCHCRFSKTNTSLIMQTLFSCLVGSSLDPPGSTGGRSGEREGWVLLRLLPPTVPMDKWMDGRWWWWCIFSLAVGCCCYVLPFAYIKIVSHPAEILRIFAGFRRSLAENCVHHSGVTVFFCGLLGRADTYGRQQQSGWNH